MILKFRNGDTELNLVDQIKFMVEDDGWAPVVPARVPSVLGGREPHEEPTETIAVHVFGNRTAAGALANLAELVEFMWSLEEHLEDDDGDPSIMEVIADGSDRTEPLQAMMLGAPYSGSMVTLPANFVDGLISGHIAPVTIAFRRRAGLLDVEDRAQGNVVEIGEVSTADFDEAVGAAAVKGEPPIIQSPTKLAITNIPPGTALGSESYVLVSGEPKTTDTGTNFKIYVASEMTAVNFGSVDDSANKALDDDVWRIDASSDQSGTLTIEGVNANVCRMALYMGGRNNHATTIWRVRARSTGFETVYGQWVEIDVSSQEPRILPLGEIIGRSGIHQDFVVEFETDETVGTLDINYICIFPVGVDSAEIFIEGDDKVEEYNQDVVVDPRALENETGLVSRQRTENMEFTMRFPADTAVYFDFVTIGKGASWRINKTVVSHQSYISLDASPGIKVVTLVSDPSELVGITLGPFGLDNVTGMGVLTNLTSFVFSTNNYMTQIDTDGMVALETLSIPSSDLQIVRVGHHPNLVTLNINNASVETIALLGMSSLTTLNITSGELDSVDNLNVPTGIELYNFYENGMNEAEVDAIIDQIYAARADYTYATPALYLDGSNSAPSGTYQYAATPSTGKEKLYALENDDDSEGFNTWTVNYTA